MASLNKEPNGNYTVQLVGTDGKRRSLRLGKVPKKAADSIKLRIESLHACAVAGLPWDADLAAWTASVGDDMAAKLVAMKLIPARKSQALGAFLEEYVTGRALTGKPGTAVTLQRVQLDLVGFFGASVGLRAVGPDDAERFKRHYLERKLAAATVSRRLKNARMFFTAAMDRGFIAANPFAKVSHRAGTTPERLHFISTADTAKLIAAANPQWQILIALARLGGLRCASEVLSLKWEHVNFETNRMTVPSCKTEHHGKAWRTVPIFADLRPHLEQAFALAPAGAEYVVPGNYRQVAMRPGGWQNISLSTRFLKIIRRAGLTPWPQLFQNLRASKETDLMQHHPIHVVTAWMGNTPRIALANYLQTLERDFEKATGVPPKSGAEGGAVGAEVVQFTVQSQAGLSELEPTWATETPADVGFSSLRSPKVFLSSNDLLGEAGFEPAYSCEWGILSPLRLPVPPLARVTNRPESPPRRA